jgi:hypothetical protein
VNAAATPVDAGGARPSPFALAAAAWRDLVRDGALFARLAFVPFAWMAATGIFFATYVPFGTAGWFAALHVLSDVAGALLLMPTATAWHRLVVLGRDHPQARLSYAFRRDEWRYFLRGLTLFALMIGISLMVLLALGIANLVFGMPLPSQDGAGFRLVLQPFMLVLCLALLAPRLLVLPAAAVGGEEPVELLLARARRAHWPVVFALVLVFAPWLVVAAALQRALQASPALASVPLALLQLAMIAASLGVLSHAYLAIGAPPSAAAADA